MTKRAVGGVLAAVAVLAAGACEGPNLFTGPVGSEPNVPEVLSVVVPQSVSPSGVLDVEAAAESENGITQVRFTLIEAIVRERTLSIDPPELDVTVFTEFQLPATLSEGSVVLRVEVRDRLGAVSDPFEVEIPVLPNNAPF